MKYENNKSIAACAAILMLIASTLLSITPTLNAQTLNLYPSYCFVVAAPNPIGIGQPTVVNFWMADVTAGAIGATGNFYSKVTVNIVQPDGTNITKGPYTLNSLATGYFEYTPSMVGDYVFQMFYPGETFQTGAGPLTYSSAMSQPYKLVVQSSPIQAYPQSPAPDYYWNRPINAMNIEWSAVSGNWLMAAWNFTGGGVGNRAFDCGSSYCGEGISPSSAHILWTSPLAAGGLVGGLYNEAPYYTGASYEQFFEPPIIMNGIIYYETIIANEPSSLTSYPSITAVSLNTGQKLFTIENTTINFGQIYTYVSPNQAGGYNYFWSCNGDTWKMYDAGTGKWILTLVGVPSGVTIPSSDGSILVYTLTPNANGYVLSLWNSTRAISIDNNHDPAESNDYWTWRPFNWQLAPSKGIINATGTTIDSYGIVQDTNGVMWSKQEPNPIPGAKFDPTPGFTFGWSPALSLAPFFDKDGQFDGNDIVAIAVPGGGFGASFAGITWDITSKDPVYVAAYNMQTGAQDYTSKLDPPNGLPNDFGATILETYSYNGHFYNFIKQTMQWAMWDQRAGGQPKWISQPYSNAWGTFAQAGGKIEVDGLFYAAGWDGEIHAYDVSNGNEVFDFKSTPAGFNTPYGIYPFYGGITVTADGKLIAQTAQHGNGVLNMYPGQSMYVINSKTGASLWNMTGWWNYGALADGVWVVQNNYDNQIYAFGKGPTATTVEAPLTQIAKDTSFIIQGTVTDQSPGAKGTPAISDQYMSEWMAYLYEQQALPSTFPCDCAGVPVTLTATNLNRQTTTIGTAVVDSSGNFAYTWAPTTAGSYIITATFGGSNSYYKSSAETCIVVGSVSGEVTPSPAPAPGGETVATWYIVAAAVVIIIIVILAAIILRRRK